MTIATERRLAHFLTPLGATLQLRNDRLFAALLLLAAVPLWIGAGYLPMVDMQ